MAVTLEELAYRILPRVEAGRALADSEWRTLVRAAETLLVDSPADLPPEQVADNVERFLCAGRSRRAWRIRVLLTLVEYSPLLSRHRPFSCLALERRRSFIERNWVAGEGVFGLCARVRLLAIMGSYGDPRAWEPIGFVPVHQRPRFARGRQKRLAVYHERVAGVGHGAAPAGPS